LFRFFKTYEMIYIGTREYKYGRMLMSHMVSDSLDELHAFAEHIGVDKKHFQNKKDKPHYDICKAKKIKALTMFGVKEVDDKQIVLVLKNLNKALVSGQVCDHYWRDNVTIGEPIVNCIHCGKTGIKQTCH